MHTPSSPWFGVSMVLIGVIVGYAIATGVNSPSTSSVNPSPSPAAAQPTAAAPAQPPPSAGNPASPDDDIVLGKASAPVTLIEFSDFQCPFCRRFWRDTLPQIREQYIDTGKVKYVYRDFPLSFHPGAEPAARAMECAEEQGEDTTWAVHDEIFKGQDAQGQGTIQFTADDIKSWAANVRGLDTAAFNECLDSNKYADEVQKDIADGSASGVNGTPGFWVLGPDGQAQPISGAQPIASFQSVIDGMLQ